MTTWNARTLRLLAGIAVLSAAATTAFAQSAPPGWASLTPLQTLGPTQQEMFPGPPNSPPATLHFGAALAVDHGTALIGMPGYPGAENSGTSDEGAVAIFVERSGSWARAGTLRANDAAADDFFGERVALLGDLAAVQAESGIYVFRRTTTGTAMIWSEIQKLAPPAGTHFDGGLAIGNATIFVGAPTYGGPGAVFVFEPDLNRIWHAVQLLGSGDMTSHDYFGGAIAVAAGTLVIGAAGEGEGRGAAFVFVQRGSRWSMQQELAPTDERTGASFGAAVAVSGMRIVVGAPEADVSPSLGCFPPASGAAYVYGLRNSVWERQTKIATPAPDCAGDFSTGSFGTEVAVSAAHLVSATPSEFPFEVGGAFVFSTDGAAEVPAGDAVDPSIVSTPVLALSEDVLFVGLPYDRGFSTGMAEVFELGAAPLPVGASGNGLSGGAVGSAD